MGGKKLSKSIILILKLSFLCYRLKKWNKSEKLSKKLINVSMDKTIMKGHQQNIYNNKQKIAKIW